jgi:hypothetical protein
VTRYIHPVTSMVFVHTHHADGTTTRHRVDGHMALGRYETSRDELRRKAEACGGTLDSTAADELHRQGRIARRRYDAAAQRWMRTQIGASDREYPHPGNPSDWVPARRAS